MKKLTGFLIGVLFLVNTSYAAVTWVTTETATAPAVDSSCIDSPSDLQIGDLLLAYVAISNDYNIDPDTSEGASYATWTQLLRDESSEVGVYGGWRLATADDVSDSDISNTDTYCFDWSGSNFDFTGQIRVYRGVAPTDPVDDYNDSEGSSLKATAPPVTTTGSNRMIVRFVGWEEDTVPADLSPAHNHHVCLAIEDDRGVTNCGADLVQGSTGSSGEASWTRGSWVDENWFTLTVALTPAPVQQPQQVPTMPVWVLVLTGLLLILLVRRRLVI